MHLKVTLALPAFLPVPALPALLPILSIPPFQPFH